MFIHINDDETLEEYLPYNEFRQVKWVDKNFFWGITFAIKPNWANQFYDACI